MSDIHLFSSELTQLNNYLEVNSYIDCYGLSNSDRELFSAVKFALNFNNSEDLITDQKDIRQSYSHLMRWLFHVEALSSRI